MQNIKDNFDALNTSITSAIEGVVPNGSFEIDSDSDGIPDNWTRYQYSGGTGAFDTSTPAHGAKAYKFTATTSSGGGSLTSDYIPCSEHQTLTFRFIHKASVAGMRNIVRILWYTAAKAACATPSTDLYDSTSNPTSWTEYIRGVVPPSTARYCKVVLYGGYPSATTGTAYFDAISVEPKKQECIVGHATGTMTYLQSVSGISVGGTAIATTPQSATNDAHTYDLSGSKINIAGNTTVTVVLSGPTSGTLSLALPQGYWTVIGIGHWKNGDGTNELAGAWRLTGIAIREA
jgi:hypothetical protein